MCRDQALRNVCEWRGDAEQHFTCVLQLFSTIPGTYQALRSRRSDQLPGTLNDTRNRQPKVPEPILSCNPPGHLTSRCVPRQARNVIIFSLSRRSLGKDSSATQTAKRAQRDYLRALAAEKMRVDACLCDTTNVRKPILHEQWTGIRFRAARNRQELGVVRRELAKRFTPKALFSRASSSHDI